MQRYETKTIRINKKSFGALIADTYIKRMLGLMFRNRLGRSECMLFVFSRTGKHKIWMYNMRFPIDVLWLDVDYKIVDMEKQLKPCSSIPECKESCPRAPAKYIIELNSGEIKRAKVNINSKVVVAATDS
jgi:uncharacterized membrane protein (UPF0127 family)